MQHALRELLEARSAGGPVTPREAATEAQLRRTLAGAIVNQPPRSVISKPALARMKQMHEQVMRSKQAAQQQKVHQQGLQRQARQRQEQEEQQRKEEQRKQQEQQEEERKELEQKESATSPSVAAANAAPMKFPTRPRSRKMAGAEAAD
jgi:hypothetical protein